MSKAAEKADRRRLRYKHNAMALERLLAHYEAGDAVDDQGLTVSGVRIASEIVGKYRALGCCMDRNGVSFDGPMQEDIQNAIHAAFERGKLSGK